MRLPDESDWRTDDMESHLEMTPSIQELTKALNAAYFEITEVAKTAKAHQYKYAPLEAITPMIRAACLKCGLVVVQCGWSPIPGYHGITTLISHTSGEWMKFQYAIPLPEQSRNMAQSIGGIQSYLRRYSINSLFMIATEDEDAVHAKEEKKTIKFSEANPTAYKKLLEASKVGMKEFESIYAELDEDQRALIPPAEYAQLKKKAQTNQQKANAH